jgi:glycosyltransferase involved in cell wall biosynthesis
VATRILLLITDLKIGGTPTVVRELALRLNADEDFEVEVACLDQWGPVAEQLRDGGVSVTALGAAGKLDARVIFRLVRLIREKRIDTVFSFLVHANAVAAVASRFVSGVRFIQSIQTTQPKPSWHWAVQNVAANSAETIVAPSPSAAQATEKLAGVQPRKILVIPNAVDLPEEAAGTEEEDESHVGFIGRLDAVKRVPDLVTASSLLFPPVILDIFGEGEERKHIEAVIESLDLGDRVILHGAVAGPVGALASIDVLVLPSDAEGFGLVLIEAMAAGVPVVGTKVPGIRDVIEDGMNGLLVPARNPQALADAIAKVLSDKELRQRLVTEGLKTVEERFTWGIVYPQYRALLLGEK